MPPSVQRQLAKMERACLDLILGCDLAARRQPAEGPAQCREKSDVMRPPEDPNSRAVLGGELPATFDAFDVPAFPRVDGLVDKTHEGGMQGGVEDPAATRANIYRPVPIDDPCFNAKAFRKARIDAGVAAPIGRPQEFQRQFLGRIIHQPTRRLQVGSQRFHQLRQSGGRCRLGCHRIQPVWG